MTSYKKWEDAAANKTFVALDLGTANVVAYLGGQGIIYNEPSTMAYNILHDEIIAVGMEAYDMVGKTNSNIRIVTPLVDGVIADLDAAKDLIRVIFARITKKDLKDSLVVLACPSSVTELERNALREVVSELGASDILIEEEVKLSAVGAGVNIWSPFGNLVIDIGGGTTDIAVIASGEIVISRSIKIAGNVLNDEIKKYIRSEYNVVIGPRTAERIKKEVGTLSKVESGRNYRVYGRDIISGLPREVVVSQQEIKNCLLGPFSRIIDLIVDIMENTPPELSSDIIVNGITVCGGGALIKGFEDYLKSIFQFNVHLAHDPLMTVIDGAREYEKNMMKWVAVAQSRKEREYKI
ncbi:rod shape-determining protein MreB [Spiroplasma sp. TIUS-1]|uniref:rod shape-determining protein n=1 Tax=Spiroplasma sp. TIUS-1 TaxID=216963 RepID=UPI0013989120|nr:rod shape-determining protein [Spiroplasma sp. TIUS-1]QHX36244.1 rod shape-determining protein MreB [Spiroplasma sp. TIUS-1]